VLEAPLGDALSLAARFMKSPNAMTITSSRTSAFPGRRHFVRRANRFGGSRSPHTESRPLAVTMTDREIDLLTRKVGVVHRCRVVQLYFGVSCGKPSESVNQPLGALRSFDAAARHQSFTRAAEELCVTQGAVSHQVKALEAELGVKLFNRERNGLVITSAGGGDYLAVVRDAFDRIALGTEQLTQRQRSGPLAVSTSPDFAALSDGSERRTVAPHE
jgi:hypothetical protein